MPYLFLTTVCGFYYNSFSKLIFTNQRNWKHKFAIHRPYRITCREGTFPFGCSITVDTKKVGIGNENLHCFEYENIIIISYIKSSFKARADNPQILLTIPVYRFVLAPFFVVGGNQPERCPLT